MVPGNVAPAHALKALDKSLVALTEHILQSDKVGAREELVPDVGVECKRYWSSLADRRELEEVTTEDDLWSGRIQAVTLTWMPPNGTDGWPRILRPTVSSLSSRSPCSIDTGVNKARIATHPHPQRACRFYATACARNWTCTGQASPACRFPAQCQPTSAMCNRQCSCTVSTGADDNSQCGHAGTCRDGDFSSTRLVLQRLDEGTQEDGLARTC